MEKKYTEQDLNLARTEAETRGAEEAYDRITFNLQEIEFIACTDQGPYQNAQERLDEIKRQIGFIQDEILESLKKS